MSSKTDILIPLGGGAAVGALAGVLLVGAAGYFYVSGLREEAMKGWTETPVLTLARDIRKGELITAADVVGTPVPVPCTTEQTLRPGAALPNARARVDLTRGDILDRSLLAGGAP